MSNKKECKSCSSYVTLQIHHYPIQVAMHASAHVVTNTNYSNGLAKVVQHACVLMLDLLFVRNYALPFA
jgi:hypothetical protein